MGFPGVEGALAPMSMSQKIVMIGTSLLTQGGISSVLRVMATRRDLLGGDVRMLATHVDGSKARKLGVALRALLTYGAMLATGRVKLLHAHSASGPSFWRKLAFMYPSMLCGRPVVLHWHGGGFVDFFRRCAPWQQRIIADTFARCDRVIALSEQWNKTLTKMFPEARVTTIPNPVELPASPALLEMQPPTALFLGRIVEAKGVIDLLHAWPKVLESVPSAQLVLAGAGDIGTVSAVAERLGVSGLVEFTGWVDGDRKLQLLRRASVFVLPSHAEAMPMAVLEAMAFGLPVVATRVGGIPHAARDGTDGLLVEVGDVAALAAALTAVLANRALCTEMGASARQRVAQHFSADLVLPRIRQVWREVLSARGGLGLD